MIEYALLLGTAYLNPLPDTASLTFMQFLYKKLNLKKNAHRAFCANVIQEIT
jgi:hypothetical protein